MGTRIGHVEIYKSAGGGVQPWRFRPIAGNGEILFTTEGYFSKWNAKRAARKIFGRDVKIDVLD